MGTMKGFSVCHVQVRRAWNHSALNGKGLEAHNVRQPSEWFPWTSPNCRKSTQS